LVARVRRDYFSTKTGCKTKSRFLFIGIV